jgi:hypothetical protein
MASQPWSRYSCPITLRLISSVPTTEVPVLFCYDVGDPFAVRMEFGSPDSGPPEVVWLVARELLRTGLERRAGDGDVQVGPAEATDVLFLYLGPPSGEALFELSRTALAEFVRRTEALVPPGTEAVDLDDELAVLLSDGRADPTDR